MATTTKFDAMLNEFLPEKLLRDEFIKRDWLLSNCEKDDSWLGGNLVVPFEGAGASSVKFGSLTAENDIAEYDYQRGGVSTYKEVWGTLKFNHHDLMRHGEVSEQNFLKILPGQIDNFLNYMKEAVSENLLNGSNFAIGLAFSSASKNGGGSFAGDGTDGAITVNRVERFQLGQKVTGYDGIMAAQLNYYVVEINVSEDTIVLSDTRGGAAADLSVATGDNIAPAAFKLYHDGVLVAQVVTNSFQGLTDALLAQVNGGSTNLYGISKLAFPYLQAINVDGSGLAAGTFTEGLFNAYTDVRSKGRGNASKIVMSYQKLGAVMKHIETGLGGNGSSGGKGMFKVSATSTKASLYGWTEIEIVSVKGSLTIVGVQEMADDKVLFLDMSAFKFYSNGMFKKRTAPDGKQYFEVRAASGYSYILDMSLFGELVLLAPSKCAIMHSIPAF